jgi:hypothetical protein
MKNRWAFASFVLIMLAFVIVSLMVSAQKSAIYEEPNTLNAGYYFWLTNDYRMGPVHAPLSYKIAALPLLVIKPDFPFESQDCKDFLYYRCANDFLFNSGNNGDFFIFLARIPFIILGAVLGFFVFAWAKRLYGMKAGLLALLLYAFCAPMVAWMGIALNEATVIAFIFISLFFLSKFVASPTRVNFFLSAIAFGLAQASKITALFLFPVYLAAFIYMWRKKSPWPFFNGKKIGLALNFLLLVFVVYLVVFVVYGFSFTTFANGAHPKHLELFMSTVDSKLAEGSFANKAIDYAVYNVPIPFPTYFDGVMEWVYMSTQATKISFLNGEVYHGGRWLFHIEELLFKTPVPLLLLILLAIVTFRMVKPSRPFDEAMMLLFILVFFFMFIFVIKWNYGISHMLPVFPLLIVFASRVAKIGAARIFVALMLVWYVIGFAMAFPNYLTYFNELAGGPGNGYKYFAGGNNDAGQDLKPLSNYLKEANISHVYLSYLGAVPPEYYGINYSYLPSPYFEPWVPVYAPLEKNLPANFTEDCSMRKGIVAVSVINLQGVYLLNQTCYSWLRDYEPVAKVGHSIFVYNTT